MQTAFNMTFNYSWKVPDLESLHRNSVKKIRLFFVNKSGLPPIWAT
jgi:hypothetical protein